MRSLTTNELQQIYNEEEMLKGCINRMCVTKDAIEFNAMYESAMLRLISIFEINLERFKESEV